MFVPRSKSTNQCQKVQTSQQKLENEVIYFGNEVFNLAHEAFYFNNEVFNVVHEFIYFADEVPNLNGEAFYLVDEVIFLEIEKLNGKLHYISFIRANIKNSAVFKKQVLSFNSF